MDVRRVDFRISGDEKEQESRDAKRAHAKGILSILEESSIEGH